MSIARERKEGKGEVLVRVAEGGLGEVEENRG